MLVHIQNQRLVKNDGDLGMRVPSVLLEASVIVPHLTSGIFLVTEGESFRTMD